MTQSRELSNYCQESVRPTHSRRYAEALQNLDNPLHGFGGECRGGGPGQALKR